MTILKTPIAFLLIALVAAFPAHAELADAAEAGRESTEIPADILAHYTAAADGDSKATEKAYEALTQLRETKPDSALVTTVLGSTEAMMARDSFIPWRQLKYVEKGMARIDKGISMLEPDDAATTFQGIPITLWVKNTAGCTYVEVPRMFNRLEMGYEILKEALQSEEAASLPFEKLASTYMCAGIAATRLDNPEGARQYLQPIIDKMPGSEEAKQAGKLLKKI